MAASRGSRWWPTGPDRSVDLALAAAVTTLTIAGALGPATGVRDGGNWLVALAALAGLALVWRRTRPLASFLVITGVLLLVEALRWELGWIPWAFTFSGYALGAHGSRRSAVVGLGAALTAMAGLAMLQVPGFDSWLDITMPAALLLVWAFGRVVAFRRTLAGEAHRHARQVARTSALATEQAVVAERMRVARELHDTVTGHLAVVAVHAATHTEAHTEGTTTAAAGAVLARIEYGARASLDDLRRMLGAMRQGDDTYSDTDSDTYSDLGRSLSRVTGWTPPPTPPRRSPQKLRSFLNTDWPTDVALGLGVMAVNVTGSLVTEAGAPVQYREPVVWVLALLAAVPGAALIVRRHFPVAVLGVVFAIVTLVQALSWQDGTLPGALLIATYTVGAWAPLRRGALAMLALCGVSLGAAIALYVTGVDTYEEWADPESALVIGTPWVVGILIGRRRRAAHRAVQEARDADRAHAIAEERAVSAERMRVVRDLHDIIGHGLAAIAVEAAVARSQFGERDFAVIDDASHAALDALRDMLDLLQGTTPDEPAPGLSGLDDLVGRHRAAYGPVTLTVDQAVAEESASVRLTVHRIVQEALTNVGRHAPGASATVTVRGGRDGVEVIVEDDGRCLVTSGLVSSGTGPGSGFGLAGMRERIELFNGALAAGPIGPGGFRVHAVLPRDPRC